MARNRKTLDEMPCHWDLYAPESDFTEALLEQIISFLVDKHGCGICYALCCALRSTIRLNLFLVTLDTRSGVGGYGIISLPSQIWRCADEESGFAADLRGLATTDMATDQVERLLRAVPDPKGWEIGEALAECVLREDSNYEMHWPWNTVRDRRTPRASLPGADLVGFCRLDGAVWLTFGEVKTSSEVKAPPNVMSGGSGMGWQLEGSAKRPDIQRTLLQWLHTRCSHEPPTAACMRRR
ncbi:MAG: hypothetical protein F4094_02155 [Synechococcus sp. SB0672_bin_6]|nr:hypothetical protein [Synechococcus sp. SB0663_bin_10]MYC50474.1 hypothetical protein [Synechococcus sp. SB0662_bin_14]MYJ59287.1 hypothetical protein [Synechococcus sp. SB0672_bin_6]